MKQRRNPLSHLGWLGFLGILGILSGAVTMLVFFPVLLFSSPIGPKYPTSCSGTMSIRRPPAPWR